MSTDPLPTTVDQALHTARTLGLDRLDARMLLCATLRQPASWLLAHGPDAIEPERAQAFMDQVARRAAGEPIAYILGDKEFFGLSLNVSPSVLIPRPDTETLVHWALECIPEGHAAPFSVLDLGTGSGAIALALQHARPQAQVTAVDFSPSALATAAANAQRLGLPLRCLQGSWLAPVAGERFDLIVSNPPYIAEGDPHLAALRHEPITALTAGPDGLDDLRHIVAQAPAHLQPGAWLLLEHGYDQAEAVQALLRAAGFEGVTTRHDLGEQPRCTGGHLPA
ncbi:peptide chain release factor N(5)-glutamine methyltransferase [Aquabacterium sp.]|uniref:peptide chain release factor N(5)-glutamine methyltransferase n=1 Tax=Aquabacterium sp. TaxID=1872578 RepID=UPI0025C3C168|nr:peptide chain release factor N(5)-glutamine methyltransferase [Aquabacterium sp.]